MGDLFYGVSFRFMRFMLRLFHTKYTIVGAADTAVPTVYISHHQNMVGPIMSMMWLKEPVHIWVLSPFFNKKTCYKHFCDYTFSKRYGWGKLRTTFCAKVASRPICRLMKSAKAIPVYRESRRSLETIDHSISLLIKGESLLIFPDIDYTNDDPAMREMYRGFFYLEKYYYRKTGKHLAFVPLYVSQNNKTINMGDAIHFRDDISFADERQNVSKLIKNSVNDLATLCGDLK